MLLCDSVITEQGSNKNSVIGIFENINIKRFPCIYGKIGVFVNFTDAIGKYVFKLELVNVEQNAAVGYTETPALEYADKLKNYNLVFMFEGQKFDHPGPYEFRFFANGELSEIRTFYVNKA